MVSDQNKSHLKYNARQKSLSDWCRKDISYIFWSFEITELIWIYVKKNIAQPLDMQARAMLNGTLLFMNRLNKTEFATSVFLMCCVVPRILNIHL